MLIKYKNGYEKQTCDVCKTLDEQDYLVLKDTDHGVVYVHPKAEGRCKANATGLPYDGLRPVQLQ